MKYLVTGAGGQLGKEWVDFLSTSGHKFYAYSSSELDITNKQHLKDFLLDLEPDVIINCGAYTKVDDAEDNKAKAMSINAHAVKYMAQLCESMSILLVHYSTDYVFSGSENDKNSLPEGYPEDYETDPINVYGSSKREGERAIRDSGCKHLIIRVSWLCGQYGSNFVKTMVRLGSERKELKVVNDQFGSPSFTTSVVQNTEHLISAGMDGTYHLTSEGLISWYDFAKEIFEYLNLDVNVEPVDSSQFPAKAKRPVFSKLNTRKAQAVEGVNLKSWKQGLHQLINQIQ